MSKKSYMDKSNILTEISLKKILFKILHPVKDIKQTYQKLQKDRQLKKVMDDPELKKLRKDLEKTADKYAKKAEQRIKSSGFSDRYDNL